MALALSPDGLGALATAAARRHGNRPALTDAGGVTWSFAQVEDRAARGARALRRDGAGEGLRMALQDMPSTAWVVAALAILRSGASLVPLDPAGSAEENAERLALTGARLLDAPADLVARWASEEREPDHGRPDREAAVFFTSGTSGRSTGMRLPHEAFLAQARGCLRGIDPAMLRRGVCLLPPHHVLGFNLLVPLAWIAGTHVAFASGSDPASFREAVRRHRPTVLGAVPAMAQAMARAVEAGVDAASPATRRAARAALALAADAPRPLAELIARLALSRLRAPLGGSLRLLACSGAPLDEPTFRLFLGLGVRVVEAYGLTEAGGAVTMTRAEHPRPGSAGPALPGWSVSIDGDGDDGGEGVIVVSGRGLRLGTLPPSPDVQPGRLRTEDVGRLESDGTLVVTGRCGDILVLPSGRKLAPEALEARLPRQARIRDIAIAPVAGPRGAEVCAVIVPDREALRREGVLDADGVLMRDVARAVAVLPAHARPTRLRIAPGPLPRSRTLKLRRDVLAEALRDPAWGREPGHRAAGPPVMPLGTGLLARLAAIVRELSGIEPRPHSSLGLDCGLDSLSRLELLARAERMLGRALPDAAALAETLDDLVAACGQTAGESREAGANPLLAPLTETQRRAWLRARRSARLGAPFLGLAVGMARALLRLTWRMECRGARELPSSGPLIFCANHESAADALLVRAALPPQRTPGLFVLGRADLQANAPAAALLRACGVLPLDAHADFLAGLRLATRALQEGHSLVLHPEGRRAADRLGSFGAGAALLSLATGAPLVPVALRGSSDLLPPGARLPRRRRRDGSAVELQVTFGPPLHPDPAREDAAALTLRLRERIAGLLTPARAGLVA